MTAWTRRLAPVWFWALSGVAQAAAGVAMHDLSVRLEPHSRQLEAHGRIRLASPAPASLELSPAARVTSLVIDGVAVHERAPNSDDMLRWQVPAGEAGRHIDIRWQATLEALPQGRSHRDTLGAHAAVSGPRGSFLPAASRWYPRLFRNGKAELHSWRVVINLPQGQRAIVPGRLLAEQRRKGRELSTYRMDAPAEGIDLMAGPYRIRERSLKSIDGRMLRLRTLFHPEIAELADGYLDSVGQYFKLYEEWIGPYPFDGFSIVSSPTPTGFGMPTLTYLGVSVLRLPFIRHTSLGHEVLHNWWGNGVYPDYASGNWSEGLTTFMADYTYAQRRSAEKARAMRLGWLRDLSAIPHGADRPLREFTSRSHGVSAAVGYAKAAMGFVMLRDLLGPEFFDHGVRRFWHGARFTVADWRALRTAFEDVVGFSLKTFFDQWTTRSGLPELRIDSARMHQGKLHLALSQPAPAYVLDLPLRIETEYGSALREVRLSGEKELISLDTAGRATRVTLDPEYRLLRRLSPDEAPPILREVRLAGDARLLVLGGEKFAEVASALALRMLDHRPQLLTDHDPDGGTALLVIGQRERVDNWLESRPPGQRPAEVVAVGGDVQAWSQRLPGGKPLVVISADDRASLEAASARLPHFGQPSWVAFADGKSIARGLWPAEPVSVTVQPAP